MDLVDEEDDVSAGADLLEHLLQAFLEITAVAGPGDERPEVERVELLVGEDLGDLAVDDGLGQTLDDGGLADAGLTDENGVVLRPAGEDLHHALHLLVAADDRVELALAGGGGEVAAELVEDERTRRGALLTSAGGHGLLALVAGEELDDFLTHTPEIRAELDEDLSGHALSLADEAEQDVLGADVAVAQLQRLAEAELEDLLRARGERDVPARRLLALPDDLLHLIAHLLEGDVHPFECLGCQALTFVDEAEQDVLGADVVMLEEFGLFLGEHHHSAGSVSEPLEHIHPPGVFVFCRA
ncbi:Protein of uncharacterised function (DUF3170) [Mycobacteroides abscessus subsp. abscessus]|nr:Protein of uncharacterised function (DUF3170) [Mycobacteroides abscessus subsp. abscessus]